ncbi:MAG TPA: phosphatase PAP2 family protein [Ktedonobacteraceae bacterium]|nr:phosphatase PAP2 family protein [Ktedonobacteraceae bacterium]
MGTNEDRPFSLEANTDEHEPEQPQTPTGGTGHVAVRNLETQKRRRKAAAFLLLGDALQLLLFGALALSIHIHPLLPIDVVITRSFQQNQAPWLRISMLVISYPGSSFLLPTLVLLSVAIFWSLGDRLEAVFVAGLSACSLLLNFLLKVLVHRPRPSGGLVHIIVKSAGYSFPSGHVMAYIAYWGLLFAFGVILFQGRHWWRSTLLVTSAAFVVLVGPSRIYLGDHWASDVIGAYLIGGVLWGLAVGLYLPLKERGVLQTPRALARMREKKSLRSFPTKRWF